MLKKMIKKFHRSQLGLTALEITAILAVAAVLILAIWKFSNRTVNYTNEQLDKTFQQGTTTEGTVNKIKDK